MNFSSKPDSRHCDRSIRRPEIGRSRHRWILPLGLLMVLGWSGCGSPTATRTDTPSSSGSARSSSTSTQVTEESYSRAMTAGELVGFVGSRQVTVLDGGSEITTMIHNIYDAGFQVIGSYDSAGATYRFTRQGPEKLGHFDPERSFQMVSGIKSSIEFREGLQ